MKELIIGGLDLSPVFDGYFITGFGGFCIHLENRRELVDFEKDIKLLCGSRLRFPMYWNRHGKSGTAIVVLINCYPLPTYYVINGAKRE